MGEVAEVCSYPTRLSRPLVWSRLHITRSLAMITSPVWRGGRGLNAGEGRAQQGSPEIRVSESEDGKELRGGMRASGSSRSATATREWSVVEHRVTTPEPLQVLVDWSTVTVC